MIDRLSPEEVLDRARELLGDRVSELGSNFGQLEVTCARERLVEVVGDLRDGPLQFRFFTFLSAVDRSELGGEDSGGGMEVLIHLYSQDTAAHVNIHVPVDPADPHCPTVTSLFAGANWHERETREMFGIDFEGHPRLVGLYLPEDFDGHPGLRSFKLPARAQVKEWPGAKDPDEAAAGGR
ncbi:MAG: NADH-quinone oxidoreductase subunit [Actinomycetota bacterium]|jgi:NADH-quinone oxidoreductase subunit C|nr:NADH-quinone oxidoreductase subunit [Actinomycetota bacterium]